MPLSACNGSLSSQFGLEVPHCLLLSSFVYLCIFTTLSREDILRSSGNCRDPSLPFRLLRLPSHGSIHLSNFLGFIQRPVFDVGAHPAQWRVFRTAYLSATRFGALAALLPLAASRCWWCLGAMLFCSPLLLRSHSKRLFVQLRSAAMTNFAYMTRKSPEKKNLRIALRKYDPGVNRHV